MPCRHLLLLLLLAKALAQEPQVRLEGQTLDPMQRPLPNCSVTVEADGAVLAKSHSDATGCFVIGHLPHRRLSVRAIEGPDVGVVVVDLQGTDSSYAAVTVFPARTLRGVVRDSDGAPIAGAWIVAAPVDAHQLAVIDACAQSGADGSYVLDHVLAGPVQARVWAPDFEVFETAVAGEGDSGFDCVLEADPRHELTFALRSATAAQCRDARLMLTARDHGTGMLVPLPPPLRCMQPDAEGNCEVRGWSGQDRLLGRFVLPGVAVAPPFDFAPKGPSRWTCSYELRPDACIRGVLRNGDAPLGGQRLLCRPLDDEAADWATVPGRTAADGSFTVPAPVRAGERFALRIVGGDQVVTDANSRAAGSRSWYVAEHAEATVHQVQADRARAVHLRVVDDKGLAVRGASVTMSEEHDRAVQAGVLPPLGFDFSDTDGRVELSGVDLTDIGKLQFSIAALGGIAEAHCEVGAGNLDAGSVALSPTATFAGVVRDTDGKTVTGARVRLMAVGRSGDLLALTGRDGGFAFKGLPPGNYYYGVVRGGEQNLYRGWLPLLAGEPVEWELVLQ